MKLRLIACEVLYRELCAEVARSPHQIDIGFLPKGLHDIGSDGMVGRLQAAVDTVESSNFDAILMGYALCNNGIAGLRARTLPLIVPRGHDCMTMFFGSRAGYAEYFTANPGTYFLTTGWIERGEATGDLRQLSIQSKSGMDMTYEQLVEKYGEENAKYLYAELCDYTKHYRQITFLEMGVEPNDSFREQAKQRADEKGWIFDCVRGKMDLIKRLVNGPWNDEDFLVVKPGHEIVVSYDDSIIRAEPVRA